MSRDRRDRERRVCEECGREVTVRRDGSLMAHQSAGKTCTPPAWKERHAEAIAERRQREADLVLDEAARQEVDERRRRAATRYLEADAELRASWTTPEDDAEPNDWTPEEDDGLRHPFATVSTPPNSDEPPAVRLWYPEGTRFTATEARELAASILAACAVLDETVRPEA